MWTLDEGRKLFVELQPVARRAGYVLGLYGSVIEYGTGNDLDVMAFPLPDGCADAYGLALLLSATTGATLFRRAERVRIPTAHEYKFLTGFGKQVDLLVLGASNG